jgi:hypothetical protein
MCGNFERKRWLHFEKVSQYSETEETKENQKNSTLCSWLQALDLAWFTFWIRGEVTRNCNVLYMPVENIIRDFFIYIYIYIYMCVTSSSMRKLHGHKEKTAPVLLCDIIEHAQAAWTQRKHCSNIVGRVCCRHCLAMDLHVTIHSFHGSEDSYCGFTGYVVW